MTDLEMLAQEAAGCRKCGLCDTRTQAVFGVGSPEADLMFVGEAPGFHEDAQGVPFVGAAGRLLTSLLGEIGLGREDVYIANVLKCRPPGNRDPLPAEIEACTPYLERQIGLISPRVVVTLGNFATKYLLRTAEGITRLRGRRFRHRGGGLIPTYHPAAVLRGGERRMEEIRADFRTVGLTLDALASSSATIDVTGTGCDAGPGSPAAGHERAAEGDDERVQLGLF